MISENGNLQIIDFGVAGILLSNLVEDKRRTIIGTPHWMAPEVQKKEGEEVPHGTEVSLQGHGLCYTSDFRACLDRANSFRSTYGHTALRCTNVQRECRRMRVWASGHS